MLAHLLPHHGHLRSEAGPHPRLGKLSESQRLRSAACHSHGAGRYLGRSADTLRTHGRDSAAHWKYKQAHSSEDEFDKWLKEVRNALKGPTEDAVEFLDNVRLTLYTNEIVVFTPKGEPRKMPQGATVLDFAYNIHTNVGNKAIGAKVNHKIESIFAEKRRPDRDYHLRQFAAQSRMARPCDYGESQTIHHHLPETFTGKQHRTGYRTVRPTHGGVRHHSQRTRFPENIACLRMQQQG